MSEKLYRLVKIIEIISKNGLTRKTLVFIDSDNHQYEVNFPNNCKAVVFNGKVYDWYGHEAELEPNVAKVLSYFGIAASECQNRETFVVQLKNGRLAIAELFHIDSHGLTAESYIRNPQWDDAKSLIEGHALIGKPYLYCYDWSFSKFLKPPTSPNCLDEINKHLQEKFGYTCKICVDVTSEKYGIFKNTMFIKTKHIYGEPENISNRVSIYSTDGRFITLASNSYEKLNDCILVSNILDPQFSEDGSKITAFVEYVTDGDIIKTRISTDIDIIHHTHTEKFLESLKEKAKYDISYTDSVICWYRDDPKES